VVLIKSHLHIKGCLDSADRVIGMDSRCSPDHHYHISHEFINCALIAERDLNHYLEVFIQHVKYFSSFHILAHGGESAYIGEEHCGDAILAAFFNFELAGDDQFSKIGREQSLKSFPRLGICLYLFRHLGHLDQICCLQSDIVEKEQVLFCVCHDSCGGFDNHDS